MRARGRERIGADGWGPYRRSTLRAGWGLFAVCLSVRFPTNKQHLRGRVADRGGFFTVGAVLAREFEKGMDTKKDGLL